MGVLASTHPTLIDVTKLMGADGKILKVAELLSQTNQILDDMVWVEGNLPTGHQTVVRTGLAQPTWRRYYGGVQPSKSTQTKIVATCGMLTAYAEVDAKLANLANNREEYLFQQNMGHVQGMNNAFSTAVIYGDETTSPEQFTGFIPQINSTTADNAENLLISNDTGADNLSLLLVVWSPMTVFGIYPKGSMAGLKMTNKGQVTVESIDPITGGRMEAYRSLYEWDCGLCIADWRYVVRVCVDVSALTKDASAGADIIDLVSQALHLPPSLDIGRPAFYTNRTGISFLNRQIANKIAGSTLTWDMVAGKRKIMIGGVPVSRCDAMLNTEADPV